jgi:hypothetical protein
MRNPGIVSLHAVTTSNAMHYAFQTCADDRIRRMLLLQNASFLPLFRQKVLKPSPEQSLDLLEATEVDPQEPQAIAEVFREIDKDRLTGAKKALSYLQLGHSPEEFINTARRYLFLKGSNSHDYKFSSALLEDYYHVSPAWRYRFLAAGVFNLRGSEGKTNGLVERVRAALS